MRLAIYLLCFGFAFADSELTDISITRHTLGSFEYLAICGYCPVYHNEDKEADIFFIAYSKITEENRPITFCFPGGPGDAGTKEAILTFGPKRLLTVGEGRSVYPPFQIIDNPETVLEYTDLVFVDPIDCGFSRACNKANLRHIFSVEGDIEFLGQFIHNYLHTYCRWNSPVFLSGTSYGTLRCAGLAEALLQYGIALKGIILSGCALEYATIMSQRDKSMADWLLIPTCAATAWYHGRLWPEASLVDVLDYARRFTYDRFAPYMLQPSRYSHLEKSFLEKEFAELIGLSPDTIRKYNSRISEDIYAAEFFAPERKVLGRLDTRYEGDIASIEPYLSHDPSYLDALGVGPAFQHYLQSELGVYLPKFSYVDFSLKAFHSWNLDTSNTRGEPSFLQRLRTVLILNPHMKVFVGSGYYDCRTPFAATEYCFEHLDLPFSYKKNIQFEYYEAGHGFIFDHDSLKKWKQDLTRFFSE